MATLDDKYDSALLAILQNEGNISNFLNVMFGFLFRRTDFYITMNSKTDKMGFPPGSQTKLLQQVHKQFEHFAAERESRKPQQKSPQVEAPPEKKQRDTQQLSSETECRASKSCDSDGTSKMDNVKNTETSVDVKPKTPTNNISTKKVETNVDVKTNAVKSADNKPKSNTETKDLPNTIATSTSGSSPVNETEKKAANSGAKEVEDPELTSEQQVYQSNPESYNGAVRENYSWSQSITDVDVRIEVPKMILKGNQVKVVTDKQHINVGYKDSNGDIQVIVDGDLTWEVHKDESIWSLVPGEHVHINLEKKQERWWEGLFVTEPKINVRKIDCSRPMTDLDDAAQAKIEEMMYNEQQKRLGLPQSHEQKTYDMMKQAWNAEGSPFKGQPFDPSKFSVNSGGVVSINE